MTVLAKKEVRLLAPGWLAVLLLEVAIPWLGNGEEWALFFGPLTLFFGMVIIGVDSFGGEFTRGTFLSLMAQPVERRTIWRTKMTVLAGAAGVIFLAYVASYALWLHRAVSSEHAVNWAMARTWSDWGVWLAGSLIAMLIALSGGLWVSLLLRQASAAFWITFLIPLAILMGLSLVVPAVVPAKWADNERLGTFFLILLSLVYSLGGFWLAHRLFYRAQDVAWTGGVINLSRWRYFEGRAEAGASHRRRRPIRALLKKEFQLHSISLFCMGTLLILHILVLLLRALHPHFENGSLLEPISEFFWAFWLVMPVVLGCMAIAEERKLGVIEGQFCLPVSRRRQFVLKFLPVLVFGILLGGVMPMFLENAAAILGVPSDFLKAINDSRGGVFDFRGPFCFWTIILLLAFGLTLVSVFASSLARNFLQALGIAVVTAVLSLFLFPLVDTWETLGNIELSPKLTYLLMVLSGLWLLPWLALHNFKFFQERKRMWQRNVIGMAGTLVGCFVLSMALYNRAWEVLEPAEPAHGPARLTLANPPAISNVRNSLVVHLPDQRVWLDAVFDPLTALEYDGQEDRRWATFKGVIRVLIFPLPSSIGAETMLPGTNWISTTAQSLNLFSLDQGQPEYYSKAHKGYQVIGIQGDGSLWLSELSGSGDWTDQRMTRAGTGNDWRRVLVNWSGVFLLKTNGTLWTWNSHGGVFVSGWNAGWPNPNNFKPIQLDTNTDWQELGGDLFTAMASRTNGTAWRIGYHAQDHQKIIEHAGHFDGVDFRRCAISQRFGIIHQDGTLWMSQPMNQNNSPAEVGIQQCVGETNCVAAAANYFDMVVLKADGSLWRWDFPDGNQTDSAKVVPYRLGNHNDWVAITAMDMGIVALSADGGVWFWPDRRFDVPIKLPKQPKLLGNVFAGQ